MTSRWRTLYQRVPLVSVVRSFSSVTRSGRDACSAGARPQRSAGRHRHRQREAQDAWVEVQVEGAHLQERWTVGPQDGARPVGDDQPADAANHGQQQALGEELLNQPPPAGANRQPHRNLLPAAAGARQQQVGDVAAGNQQHQADHGHAEAAREHQLLLERRREGCLGQRSQRERAAAIVGRVTLGQAPADAVDVRLGLLERHAVLQAAKPLIDEAAPRVVALGAQPGEHLAVHRERHPQIRTANREGAAEAFRGDADHVEALAVQGQALADDGGVAAEAPRPTARTTAPPPGGRPAARSSSGRNVRPAASGGPSTSK